MRIVQSFKKLNDEKDVLTRIIKLVDVLSSAFIFLIDNGKTIVVLTAGILGLNIALKATAGAIRIVNTVLEFSSLGKILLVIVSITTALTFMIANINKVIDAIKSVPKFFGFSDESTNDPNFFDNRKNRSILGPQIVSPQERVARSIEEQTKTTTSEVTIKDDTGRAEVTSGSFPSNIQLLQSGTF